MQTEAIKKLEWQHEYQTKHTLKQKLLPRQRRTFYNDKMIKE
jgi:hypothetical protein